MDTLVCIVSRVFPLSRTLGLVRVETINHLFRTSVSVSSKIIRIS